MGVSRCEQCEEFLLSAEPAELREPGEWGPHLRECAVCRERAEAILAGNDVLDSALAVLTARHAGDSAPGAINAAPSRRAHRVPRWLGALVPLAAAAVLLVVVQRQGTDSLAPRARPEPRVPVTPAVNAAGGSGVAVMRTSNPDITVVWTF